MAAILNVLFGVAVGAASMLLLSGILMPYHEWQDAKNAGRPWSAREVLHGIVAMTVVGAVAGLLAGLATP